MLLFCLFFENKKEPAQDYGNLSPISLSGMTRAVAALEWKAESSSSVNRIRTQTISFLLGAGGRFGKTPGVNVEASLLRGIAGTFFKQD